MDYSRLGIDLLVPLFCQGVKETLEQCTGREVNYSNTILSIPKISIRPDMGGFVELFGDYNGLAVMNFSSDVALAIYKDYMTTMGIPAADLVKNATSVEVADTIGELINQVMGKTQQLIEIEYDLSAQRGQPKALNLNHAISLTPELALGTMDMANILLDNRRVVFQMDQMRFYMELAMERMSFVNLDLS